MASIGPNRAASEKRSSTSGGDSANVTPNAATAPQVPDTMETNMNDLVTF